MNIFMTVKLTTMYMIVVGHVVGDISCISVVTWMVFDHSYIHRPEFEPAHAHTTTSNAKLLFVSHLPCF